MRQIDADVFDGILCDAEIEATKQRKNVLASAINTIRGNMAKQPTVNQWIPCSERLPDDNVPVLITWKNTDPMMPCYQDIKDVPSTDTGIYFRGRWYWWSCIAEDLLAETGRDDADWMSNFIDVIAWMPLPDPYKEVE